MTDLQTTISHLIKIAEEFSKPVENTVGKVKLLVTNSVFKRLVMQTQKFVWEWVRSKI